MTTASPHPATDVEVVVHPGKQELSDAIAARLVTAVVDAQAARGVAHLSLTGGSLGSDIWRSVAALPARHAVDWSRVELWWGDERYLPAGDPDRNDVQNDDAGLASLALDPAHVHRVPGPDASESAEASATAYAETVRSSGAGAFDIMILGVGPDGHVASLFPGHPAQQTTDAIAVAVHDSPKPPPDRVSLTFEALRRSRQVWFVVAGADKAEAVVNGTTGATLDVSSAAQVTGEERTLWLVDADAAQRL
ncbi:6-phosphogluconolactonase [Knoellia flava TL1]|uniref:6-phosphogluconolactonase n=2 Tax=Knoellia flava TaxID=913969 RepID=A0A8H9FRW4_9MICO|nr:6-phosphogluconolactonase [Knoellia flava]KGN29267.1 6-phosphogluconolactonase [Knoellia flava TL1]GGB67257.1 6-phosphogluconolactonase [Knoellia flava]